MNLKLKLLHKFLFLAFSFLLLAFSSSSPCYALPAFPGAEGFGSETIGGRGGRVIEVTNLNDSGTGSLRRCIEASGPRICVFRTGGTIELESTLSITNPYITIAGQIAPGGGITLKNNPSMYRHSLSITTSDVIIRHIRVRPGASEIANHSVNAIKILNGASNVIIDHCSASWATDQVMCTWYDPHDITIQWSIISEGLDCSTHEEGGGFQCHSTGIILGDAGNGNISMHHNLFAHNKDRNPRIKADGIIDLVNNVIYNSGECHVSGSSEDGPVNFINNYQKVGPNNINNYAYIKSKGGGDNGVDFFVQGNIGYTRTNNDELDKFIADEDSWQFIITTPAPAPFVTTFPCNSLTDCETYNEVLANAGAIFPMRDAVDKRIIKEAEYNEGKIIDCTSRNACYGNGAIALTKEDYTKYGINDPIDDAGYPILALGTPPEDSDHDGMPDNWEMAHFGNLDQGSATDSSSDDDNDGYTDLEEFLNGTNPKDGSSFSPSPSPSPSPSSIPGCEADINEDGTVNLADINMILTKYGNSCSGCSEDINQDEVINLADIVFILQYWGLNCE